MTRFMVGLAAFCVALRAAAPVVGFLVAFAASLVLALLDAPH